MKVVLTEHENKACPKDFPDDVVYKVWPGTRPYCDCTKRGNTKRIKA
jgi:hypothetical protein